MTELADSRTSEEQGKNVFPDTPLVLTGSLMLEDVLEFQRVLMWRRWWKVLLGGLFVALFLGFLEYVAYTSLNNDPMAAFRIHLTVAGVIPVLFLGSWLLGRWRLTRIYQRELGVFTPTVTTVSFTGFTVHQGHVAITYDWQQFSYSRLTGRLCLLFIRGERDPAMFFARSRFGSDEDWARFRTFLAKRLPDPLNANS